jgi:suppressor of fused protein SUFU
MTSVPDHLERYLGQIRRGWSTDSAGQAIPFQVVEFEHGPFDQTAAFATLGLGRQPLHSRVSGRHIQHELVMAARLGGSNSFLPGIVIDCGLAVIASGTALLRGDVIGPRGPIAPGSEMEALYASNPVYFPDGFEVVDDGNGTTVFVWLVPISRAEAEYVRQHGWEAFEQLLDEKQPNLVDLGRRSIVEPGRAQS